jgi:hypothetical protein
MLHVTIGGIMTKSIAIRVQKHRNALRASGLRPIQIWVPDIRRPGFAKECLRQSKLLQQDLQEQKTLEWIAAVYDDKEWQ